MQNCFLSLVPMEGEGRQAELAQPVQEKMLWQT